MCLGVPGRITRRWEEDGALLAEADFAGETRTIRLNYLPELAVGDHTIVHAGFALTRVSPEEAATTIAMMRQVGLLPDEGESAEQIDLGSPQTVPAQSAREPSPTGSRLGES
ncbi:MAG: HypC/HybG/HupF family hydrogenase formation chaperone [Nostocoides sp.]